MHVGSNHIFCKSTKTSCKSHSKLVQIVKAYKPWWWLLVNCENSNYDGSSRAYLSHAFYPIIRNIPTARQKYSHQHIQVYKSRTSKQREICSTRNKPQNTEVTKNVCVAITFQCQSFGFTCETLISHKENLWHCKWSHIYQKQYQWQIDTSIIVALVSHCDDYHEHVSHAII